MYLFNLKIFVCSNSYFKFFKSCIAPCNAVNSECILKVSYFQFEVCLQISGFHLTSWRPCWCILNNSILMISFVWNTNMAAMSVVFCVSWDCVKTKNTPTCWQYNELKIVLNALCFASPRAFKFFIHYIVNKLLTSSS